MSPSCPWPFPSIQRKFIKTNCNNPELRRFKGDINAEGGVNTVAHTDGPTKDIF